MKTWKLREADLLQLLKESNLEPAPGSPLGGLQPLGVAARLAPIEDKPQLTEALSRVTGAEVVLGMVILSPPGEPEFSWFYGTLDDGNYAYHGPAEDGGHEITWPVDSFLLLRSLQAPLAMEVPAEREEISLVLDRGGFETLAAMTDLFQEKNLLALLRRTAPQEAAFEEIELLECCERSRSSQDLRWMVPRIQLLAPVGLRLSDEDLRRGLAALVAGELLAQHNGRFEPTPALGLVCAGLAATTGMSALSTHRRQTLSHLAAVRMANLGLWLIEFSEITAEDFNVRITSMAQAEMVARLRAGLGMPAGKAAVLRCPACAAALRTGARFCAKCGYRLASKL